MKNWLSIGQFARRTGASPRALRLYEKMGLIQSVQRGENGYRYYRESLIPVGRKIRELKALGFSLAEIQVLLGEGAALEVHLKNRLGRITEEEKVLSRQRQEIQFILSSIQTGREALNPKERKYIMSLFENALIVVTGVEDLQTTGEYIGQHLLAAKQRAQILAWDGQTPIVRRSHPLIVLIDEKNLNAPSVKSLDPDIVVVKNVSAYSPEAIASYLHFYRKVGPNMATVLNADDRASIEIAKSPLVQKGKIYYYSKNSGLKSQIEKIGGIVSDGEQIQVFGLNRARGGVLNIKVEKILSHTQEIAIMAALAAVMDLGMNENDIRLSI